METDKPAETVEPVEPEHHIEPVWIGILNTLMQIAGDNEYTLSQKSGVSQATVNRLMNGKHIHPRILTMQRLAEAYNLLTSQILGEVPIDYGNTQLEVFYSTDTRKKLLHHMIDEMPDDHMDHAIRLMQAVRELYIERREREQRAQENTNFKYVGEEKRHIEDRRDCDEYVPTRIHSKIICKM